MTAYLERLIAESVRIGELASKYELWRPKDLTPGVEKSTAGRFSFLTSYSRVSYTFRGLQPQTAAISVCKEISVSRTQPSRLRPTERKIGPELSDSLFLEASGVNTEFSFDAQSRPVSNSALRSGLTAVICPIE
jgi:hypothetical protein